MNHSSVSLHHRLHKRLTRNLDHGVGCESSAAQIDRIAAVLKEYPQTVVDIAGHTDSTGSAEANQALSQKRAGAVALRFVKAGLPYARMVVSGYGATRPVADNASEAGRAANLRAALESAGVRVER